MYFQIVGTHNTANEVFHAVHFESPAQPDSEIRRPAITHNEIEEDIVNQRLEYEVEQQDRNSNENEV